MPSSASKKQHRPPSPLSYHLVCRLARPPLRPPLFPYTTLFRSRAGRSSCSSPTCCWSTTFRSARDSSCSPRFVVSATRRPGQFWACATSSIHPRRDRKSTRLNSSHLVLSYAVFRFKKTTPPSVPALLPPCLSSGSSTAPPSPLSLHDALPISRRALELFEPDVLLVDNFPLGTRLELLPALRGLRNTSTRAVLGLRDVVDPPEKRSEEHTSELQSPCTIVCRLPLQKNNTALRPRSLTTLSVVWLVHRSALPSFPTRRSSDLAPGARAVRARRAAGRQLSARHETRAAPRASWSPQHVDPGSSGPARRRRSTREEIGRAHV